MPPNELVPVILCGGSGTRLWPLSRQSFPKQFLTLKFTNRKSLLQNTQERIKKLKNIQPPIIICNEEHRFIVGEQMRDININPSSIILEPFGKNTAPAITIAALKALEIYQDPTLLILSSDHEIQNLDNFLKVIKKGTKYSERGNLVTFGVVPTSAEIGYGYIKSEKTLDKEKINASKIKAFIEKPNKVTAEKFIKDNKFSWNSGIFLFKAKEILKELEKFNPEIKEICKESLRKNLIDLDFQRLSKDIFKKCPNVSIDIAVMEKTSKAYVLPLNSGWSDIGSWEFVWNISKKDDDNNVIQGNVVCKNTKNSLIHSDNRLIATIGIKDLIIVDTSDAILISKKNESQEVKYIVEELKKKEIPQGTQHIKNYRPWGEYESIAKNKNWQVKIINVKVGQRLSLQKHKHRSEHWIVVSGIAKIEIEGKEMILNENESSYIPIGSKHRLTNYGDKDLKIIEVQSGDYIGEDDIFRFEDNYGRTT